VKNVRHYPPFENDGAFSDFLDALHTAGAAVSPEHHPNAHASWNGASYVMAADEDGFRIQLATATDVPAAWSQIERVHEPWMSHVHGDEEIGAEDSKTYGPFTEGQAQAMLAKVRGQGMTVTGNNPWHVDTNTHGVKFDASYDGTSITIKITGANFYVSNAKVWDKLDPMMQAAKNISGAGEASSSASSAQKKNANAIAQKSGDEKEGAGIGLGVILIGIVAAVLIFGKK
jgi:hypothetical protein